MAHPKPDLQMHPVSGLPNFPWAEDQSNGAIGTFDAKMGSDGVGLGFVMFIYWENLEQALQEILGYSYRSVEGTGQITNATNANPIVITTAQAHGLTTGLIIKIASVQGNTAANGTWQVTVLSATTFSIPTAGNAAYTSGGIWTRTILRRVLPWQHPYFNQLSVKSVTKVEGIVLQEIETAQALPGASRGVGAGINQGPWSNYYLARLTIQFWRPPYYQRSDIDILDSNGNPQEWLRYVDKNWEVSTQLVSREGSNFNWAVAALAGLPGPPGAVGVPVTHQKLVRRWYEVPEAAIFSTDWPGDGTPGGQALNLIYTQTGVTNPITGYVYPPNSPINGTVNSTLNSSVRDNVAANRFFGMYIGTLRFDGVKIIPRDLQLPSYLMEIPMFRQNQPLSQQQYDVEFIFDLFDPPRPTVITSGIWTSIATTGGGIYSEAHRGHNTVPYAADNQWLAITSQSAVSGTAFKATPFNYTNFSDLFRIL